MDFEGFSDASLLAFMAMQADDPDTARAAFGEFYERHAPFLLPVIERRYGEQLHGGDAAEQMTIEVFWRAYEHSGRNKEKNFEVDFHDDDPERSRRSVRAWLGKVAENMFRDLLRAEKAESDEALQFDSEALQDYESPEDGIPTSRQVVQSVQRALEELPPKQREALEACLHWYNPAKDIFDMDKDAPAVAASLGTTVENLKKNRNRALKRLRELNLPEPSFSSSTPESSHE